MNAVTGAPALGPLNFRIEGGVRVPAPIRITRLHPAQCRGGHGARWTVSEPGDFSLYRLRLCRGSGSDTPPATFDIAAFGGRHRLQGGLPHSVRLPPPGEAPPREAPPPPVIDYLAKDYLGFRRLMLEAGPA